MKLLDYIEDFCEVKYRYEPTSESEVYSIDANDVPIVFSCIADMIDSWELAYFIKIEVVPTNGDGVEVWISETV